MKKTLVFGVLYVAFAVGALVTSLCGHAGIAKLDALRSYVRMLEANISELRELNASLTDELDRLQSDPESVKLLARELGYVQSGERRVVLESFNPSPKVPQVGTVLQAPSLHDDDVPRLETIYLVPLLLLFVALCIDLSRAGRDGPSR